MEDEDVEESVEDDDDDLDGDAVEQHGRWWDAERAQHERGLNHDLVVEYTATSGSY